MNVANAFEYAHARIHARYGERPSDDVWRQLRTTRTAGQLLAVARRSGLSRWVGALDARHDASELDRALRNAFSQHALEVALWVPEAWSSSVTWVASLPDLGRLDAAARGATGFRDLWPSMSAEQRRSMDALCALVSDHLERMARVDPQSDGWLVRAELEHELARCFRRSSEGPAAVFSYLGLILLDLERLRGALLRRILFPDVDGGAAWV